MGVTPYERVMTTIEMRQPDRVPIIPGIKGFSMKYAGLSFYECFENPEKFVRAQLRLIQDFEFDAVTDMYSGVPLLNEFLGAELKFEKGSPPTAEPPFASIDDFKKVQHIDITMQKRMKDVHKMVRMLKEEVRGNYACIIGIPGPLKSAALLRGIQNFYMDMVINPTFIRDLLDFSLDMIKAYAEVVIDAGADIIFTANSLANRECLSRQHYEQFVTNDEKDINAFFKSKNKKIIHHTCGDWSDRFDLAVAEGADVLFVSAKADLGQLKKEYGDKVCFMGNVDSVETMYRGTPEQIEKECHECIRDAGEGGGYILSNDCEMPPNVPVENMRAMERAGKKWGVYPLAS